MRAHAVSENGPRARDFQRSLVYAADAALFGWAKRTGHHAEFVDLASAQAFVDSVHPWALQTWPHVRRVVPIVWTRRGARSKAIIEAWRIELANGRHATHDVHFSNLYVLHELAHLYALPASRHHAGFCTVYLELVQKFVGATAAEFLLTQFRNRGVKYRTDVESSSQHLPPQRKPNVNL